MPDYSKLSDAEINAKLAEKMGYKPSTSTPGQWLVPISKNNNAIRAFSPCASRDDLAVVVGDVDEELADSIQYRLLVRYNKRDSEEQGNFLKFLLTCPPRIIAEACLEVMEEE